MLEMKDFKTEAERARAEQVNRAENYKTSVYSKSVHLNNLGDNDE